MYPKNGLKGLQLLAQSNALGKRARARRQSLCKGISFTIIRMLMPLQGDCGHTYTQGVALG